MHSFQKWSIPKKILIITLILAGLCALPYISLRIWIYGNELWWEQYSKNYHPGQTIYDFDEENASFYIQQVENNINFSHYREEWRDLDDHLIYSLSGIKYSAGVNITKQSEWDSWRIYDPNSTVLVNNGYSGFGTFSIYLNESYISMPPFQWSFPYPVYFISISMDYGMVCGSVCGYWWEDYYWLLVHENGDILVKIYQEGEQMVS